MIEEIIPGLYKIEIPIPNNPLKATNSYVIKDTDRNLIIDTGMNREECIKAMGEGLQELQVDLGKTDFFITHMHADHSGMVSLLATDSSKIFCSKLDGNRINSGSNWEGMRSYARMSGFPEEELQGAIERHPGFKYRINKPFKFASVREGDIIRIIDLVFKCIETPGHTPGHLCLYEASRRILVSGDHILKDITPNISLWSDERDPLNDYLNSLDKVYGLETVLVLPGHRRTFADHKERIRELKQHHQTRVSEILLILGKGSQNAFQVASRMKWDQSYPSWDLFPTPQKWFATGEAIAHLKYLQGRGMVQRQIAGDKMVFSLP